MAKSKKDRDSKKDKGPKKDRLSKKDYESALETLQIELNDMAHWVRHTGKRMIVVFEGRDTAGKGGAINAIADCLSPRQCHVIALGKPTEREQSQWYFQRYVPYLPAAGEIVLLDRSWYNRAGVEKVMGFATPAQVKAFLAQVPVFEKMLTDDGIVLFKYWLAVDQEKQEERFEERIADPLKRWKLSPIDVQARQKYADYGRARDEMFAVSHTANAPWFVVDFNDQRRGRLNLIRHLLDLIPDRKVPTPEIDFPALRHKPGKERYAGPVKPIKGRY